MTPVAPVLFHGVGVALVTLFHDDGSIDTAATAAHAARLVELGVKAVVVAGSTGEAAALDPDERDALLAAVRDAVPHDLGIPLIAGTGAPSARQATRLVARAVAGGADGLLVLSPPGSGDLEGYYGAVREAAGSTPVLGYHFPPVSAPGIPLELLGKLPIDGCKDSSRDPNRMLCTLQSFDRPLYTGSASLLGFAGPLGCAGAILALANAAPERCSAAFAGDLQAQLALAEADRLASAKFPSGIKALTADRFGTSTAHRLD